MIMNELLSLRGYTITKMDKLETQNQNIRNDIIAISNRLDYVNMDDDKSKLF
ncbi:unnamed protein product [Lupinus luteus]|uniref:Uncharacterized protein n=1 Tax=Lupinus luteus TaxID=3873 RepID=A0AAV1YFL1_LUPLU